MAVKKSEISTLSNRYAKALLEAASKAKATEAVSKDLQTISAVITGNAEFSNLLASGAVVAEKMKEIFADISKKLGFSEVTQNFLLTLAENKRSSIIPQIAQKFSQLILAESNTVEALIISSKKLANDNEVQVKAALEKSLGKKVITKNVVDSKILGGLKVKVGSQLFDDSISTKLEKLKTILTN